MRCIAGILLEEGAVFSLSNMELTAKYRLVDKQLKLAASVHTIWNTASKDLDKGLITGFDYNAVGVFAHVGGSFAQRGYVFTDVGLVYTTNDYSDYFQQHIEVGYRVRVGHAFWVNATLDIRKSFENGSQKTETLVQTGLHPNDQEWVGFGAGVVYEMKNNMGFNLSTGGAITAQYMGISAPITLGVYKKLL